MAVYGIAIAGNVKSILIGWNISETANGRGRLVCKVASPTGAYRPAIDDDVIITEDGIRIFGGLIDKPTEEGRGGEGLTPIVTTISAVDYNVYADRVFVTEEIPAGTLKAALLILEPYLTDFGVSLDAGQVNGPALPALSYESRKMRDVLDELSALSAGYIWDIDYNKSLEMTAPTAVAAPFNIAAHDGLVMGDITAEPSRTDYANYIILYAGTGQREVTDDFVGDAVTTTFALNYTLFSNRGYVTNGGVNEPIGVTTPPYWTYDAVTNSITRSSAPANLSAISITYTAQFPLRVIANGGAALANRVQKVIAAETVFDLTVAQALADSYLDRDSATPKTVRYTTAPNVSGIHPGQTQTITVPTRNLSGSFLITDVQIVNVGGVKVHRIVTAVGNDRIPATWRDTVRAWTGASSVAAAGVVTTISSGGVGGSGTAGKHAKFVSAAVIGDSIVSESGAALTVAGSATFTGSFITVSGTEAIVGFSETDQGADLKNWRWIATAGTFLLQTVDDAGTSATSLAGWTRSTGTFNQIGAFTVNTNKFTVASATGNTLVAGTLSVTSDFAIATTKFTVAAASGNTVLAGTLTAGSGAVGILDATGKIPAISSTYFASLSGTNLTGVDLLASVNTHTLAGLHTWTGGTNGPQRIVTVNTTSNTGAFAGYRLDAGTTIMVLDAFSQGYTTAGTAIAASVKLEATGIGGLTLLASSASGDVRLYSRNALAATFGASQALALVGDVAVNTNKFNITAASGNTAIAGTLLVSGTSAYTGTASYGADILPVSLYLSNIGALTNKFLTLHVAELWAQTITQANVTAVSGGRWVIPKNVASLTADVTAVATTFSFNNNGFANGDRVWMEGNGKLEWIAIASGASGAGPYTYTVTRNLDGSGANTWSAGDAVINTGTTGDGFIDAYASAGILAGSGPSIAFNVRTGTTYSNIANRVVVGNLNGTYGYVATAFGIAMGDSTNTWLAMDTTNGVRGMNGANVRFQIAANGSGRLANGNFTWDTSGNVTIAGSATIGGWTVGTGNITDTAGTVGMSSLATVADDIRFWAGNATPSSAPFRVTESGAATMTSVTISAGNVTLDTTGLFISPISAGGGGAFANANAVRWTTDTTYRTAIWRSDDSGAPAFRKWWFENISNGTIHLDTRNAYVAKNGMAAGTGSGSGQLQLRGQVNNVGEALLYGYSDDGSGSTRAAVLYLGAKQGAPGLKEIALGYSTAEPSLAGTSTSAPTLLSGLIINLTGTQIFDTFIKLGVGTGGTTQTNIVQIDGNSGEALAVSGGTATSVNINMYADTGTNTQRRATLQATRAGTSNRGGQLIFFIKPDTAAGTDVAQAGYFDFDRGFVLGAPTGGSKGLGTLNVAGDVYKNNTAYTNPDYVFEHWATGRIERFRHNAGAKDYAGLFPLGMLESYVREHYRFPMISDAPLPIFARGDVALALIEQATLYLFDHETRISRLEERLRAA